MTKYYVFHKDTFEVYEDKNLANVTRPINSFMYNDWNKCWAKNFIPNECWATNWYWIATEDVPPEYRLTLLLLT